MESTDRGGSAPSEPESAVPVPEFFLGCWVSNELHVDGASAGAFHLTVRRCAAEEVGGGGGRTDLPGVLYACYDSKVDDGRKPFFLKMRHGKVGVFQPGVDGQHRLSWIGMSAAAAPTTEEGNRIEWFMASGTGT